MVCSVHGCAFHLENVVCPRQCYVLWMSFTTERTATQSSKYYIAVALLKRDTCNGWEWNLAQLFGRQLCYHEFTQISESLQFTVIEVWHVVTMKTLFTYMPRKQVPWCNGEHSGLWIQWSEFKSRWNLVSLCLSDNISRHWWTSSFTMVCLHLNHSSVALLYFLDHIQYIILHIVPTLFEYHPHGLHSLWLCLPFRKCCIS